METVPARRSYASFLSILCGIWFLITGWLWTYYMNLVVAYPVAFLGLYLWNRGRKADPSNKLNRFAIYLLIAGLALSITVLIALLFAN